MGFGVASLRAFAWKPASITAVLGVVTVVEGLSDRETYSPGSCWSRLFIMRHDFILGGKYVSCAKVQWLSQS